MATPRSTNDVLDTRVETPGRFSVRDVARLFDLPEGKLRYWSQTGFLTASARDRGRMYYTFRDLIAVKIAKELLDAGLPLQRVRKSLGALRTNLPQVDAPLARLRIRCAGDSVIVEDRDRTFEATTGQLLLDFEVSSLNDRVAQVLSFPGIATPESSNRTAFDWFLEGCELEQKARDQGDIDDASLAAARDAYEKALEIDPQLAAAWTNLGSIRAEASDLDGARDYFDRALRCDPEQPEARVNLAELALRQGDMDVAIAGYRQVLRAAPDHREAHYGIARALISVGGKAQALAHLERFCDAVERVPKRDRDPSLESRHRRALEVIESLREDLASG